MSTKRVESETFSSVDAAWLHMDTPTNLATIVGILAFEGALDYEQLKTTLERRFLIHRRFRQRVREGERPLELPRWEFDPQFDIHDHLLHVRLPPPADHQALQEMVSDLMSRPLDPDKPLWQFHLVDNYLDGSALVCRLHHCIADGLALVQVLLATTDEQPGEEGEPEAEPQPEEAGAAPKKELRPLARALRPALKAAKMGGQAWRMTGSLVHEGVDALFNPPRLLELARLGGSATKALGKLLLIGPDRNTVLRGQCGVAKRAAWSAIIGLEDVKLIGRRMGGTINDVLISAVTGALRRYIEERGGATEGLNIRAIVPVNLRPPEETEMMGNRFGLVFLSLPVGIRDPIKRLVVLRRRMDDIKNSPEAVVAFGILGAIGMTPTQIEDLIVAIFGMKGTAVMTNVPGPRKSLYLANRRISNLMFWVPTPGNLGLGVSIVSYAGQVILGVATDEGLVPDPETLLATFHDELEFMRHWGRPSGQATAQKAPARPAGPAERGAHPPDGRCQATTQAGKRCKNRALPGSTTCRMHSSTAS